jgi:hypothetical protein
VLTEVHWARYTAGWMPMGAIDAGPYWGGAVVEIADERGRSYAADYRMVREDVAALDNSEATGGRVTRLDADAWEDSPHAISASDPQRAGRSVQHHYDQSLAHGQLGKVGGARQQVGNVP